MKLVKLPTTRALIGFVFAFLIAPLTAMAQDGSILRPRIEAALNDVETQQGRFVQIDDATGYGLTGNFYISRPGRVRFEYDDRDQLLVADGDFVAQINTRTNSVARTPLALTPLRIILSRNVNLSNRVTLVSLEETPDSLFATVYETGKRNQGLLTIFLDSASYSLRGWKIEEQDGTVTTVILTESVSGQPISNSIFEIPEN